MREKLILARFRHLNETLYTRPSAEAFGLFQDSPEMFTEYHEGFRRQVGVWPENPVSGYLADIQARGKQRFHPKSGPFNPKLAPLPRTADVPARSQISGRGDAALATGLQKVKGKLHLDIKSFDLGQAWIIAYHEGRHRGPAAPGRQRRRCRVLSRAYGDELGRFHRGGVSRVAVEGRAVGSRDQEPLCPAGEEEGCRAQRGEPEEPRVLAPRKRRAEMPPPETKQIRHSWLLEVDGIEDCRQETDVSAFVEVLLKRGFVLRGEPADARWT